MHDLTDLLQIWDEKIQPWVKFFGLNCYPQEFEICDHDDMIGYMSYSGMPSRYTHWSYGKSFERQKTLYQFGLAGLPYEMVINSNPCLAYLMRDNTLLLQVLTIAHVYGHNDFFANNFTFRSSLDAKYTLEMFRNHALRIDKYIEDPSIGLEPVEAILDHCHALAFQRSRNLAVQKRTPAQQAQKAYEELSPERDPHWEIHPQAKPAVAEARRYPLEPDEDLLQFIYSNNPYLSEWQRDLLQIVDRETSYFIPQMETKIMNEGWASYWHHKIMNALQLDQGMHMEFLVRHNQVLTPVPGGLNPYHLGFILWQDIERRWNAGDTGAEYKAKPSAVTPGSLEEELDSPGRKKMFEVRESDRDSSFLRRFLTPEIMRDLHMFQHEKRGKDRVVTKVSNDENWTQIRDALIQSVGSNSLPIIKVYDADYGGSRTLYLKHYHDGRDLQLEYAEQTLRHLQSLWGKNVYLETELNGKANLLKITDGQFKIEKA